MAEEKRRFLLLTQNPALTLQIEDALEDAQQHLVEVREVGLLEPLLERGADLVLLDPSLPDRWLEAIAGILDNYRELPVLVLDSGAADAWHRISHGNPLEAVIAANAPAEQLTQQTAALIDKAGYLRRRLIGRTEAMQELRERILQLAPTPLTVLVTGESGTGKELVAQALHHYSERHERLFRPINCAAIPENLLESELFGHERGAFTDAKARHEGIFEQAEGGTVFLDEIGEMAPLAQLKLLRVLEAREVTRVGGSQAIPVDVRVVAATNKDLQQAVGRGEFRRDLYHRLKVAELHLPSLRRRGGDIDLLVRHYIGELTRQHKTDFAGFSPAAMELLRRYEWPGNVRELRNLIEHLVFAGPRGQVQPEDLLPRLERPPVASDRLPVPTNKTPDQSERELIYYALLDLKRDVADLRRLLEERLGDLPVMSPVPTSLSRPSRPVYQPAEPLVDEDDEDAVDEGARTLQELEEDEIRKALDQVNGHRERAADLLGISVRTLFRKLEKYGLK